MQRLADTTEAGSHHQQHTQCVTVEVTSFQGTLRARVIFSCSAGERGAHVLVETIPQDVDNVRTPSLVMIDLARVWLP